MNTDAKPVRRIRVRRTYLIERIQEWVVDIPAAHDADEWKDNDLDGFDQYVTDNGDQVLEDYEHVDFDELELTVLPPAGDDGGHAMNLVEILEAHHLDVLSYPTHDSCICQRSEPGGGHRRAGQPRIEWSASARGYHSWAGHVRVAFDKARDGALW